MVDRSPILERDMVRFIPHVHFGRVRRSGGVPARDILKVDRAGSHNTRCERMVRALVAKEWIRLPDHGVYEPTEAGYAAVLEKLNINLKGT